MSPLQLDHLLEEREAKKRRLAALPHEGDLGPRLRGRVVADEDLDGFIAHPQAGVPGVEPLLFGLVAIATVEVAPRTDGLGHHGERAPGAPGSAGSIRGVGHPRSQPRAPVPASTASFRTSFSRVLAILPSLAVAPALERHPSGKEGCRPPRRCIRAFAVAYR